MNANERDEENNPIIKLHNTINLLFPRLRETIQSYPNWELDYTTVLQKAVDDENTLYRASDEVYHPKLWALVEPYLKEVETIRDLEVRIIRVVEAEQGAIVSHPLNIELDTPPDKEWDRDIQPDLETLRDRGANEAVIEAFREMCRLRSKVSHLYFEGSYNGKKTIIIEGEEKHLTFEELSEEGNRLDEKKQFFLRDNIDDLNMKYKPITASSILDSAESILSIASEERLKAHFMGLKGRYRKQGRSKLELNKEVWELFDRLQVSHVGDENRFLGFSLSENPKVGDEFANWLADEFGERPETESGENVNDEDNNRGFKRGELQKVIKDVIKLMKKPLIKGVGVDSKDVLWITNQIRNKGYINVKIESVRVTLSTKLGYSEEKKI